MLHSCMQEDLQWERATVVVDDNIEMPLTGMQIALATMQQAADGSHGIGRNNMVGLVMAMRDQIRLALLTPNKQSRFGSSCSTATATPSNKSLCYLPTPTNYDDYHEQQQQLAPFLFIFSLYQLHRRCCGPKTPLMVEAAAMPNANKVVPAAAAATTTTGQEEQPTDLLPDEEQEEVEQQVGQDDDHPSSQAEEKQQATTRGHGCTSCWPRLVAAAKCGFSLGLAVLLGLLFSNDHGFWSGLIVATTMTAGRESTWAVAVARAHGTALGSIYGVLCCVLMSQQQQLLTMDLRFVALLPWMVLATFLKRSRAYGPAGGVAAALSVVIIVGRRYDEAPMAFTIARLVETFIGISCAVLADLVFQPGARPSVQAKAQLTRCIAALADCCLAADLSSSELLLKRVQQELALLRKYAAEAGSEPTYLWMLPFPVACYDKIQGSIGRMAQLLQLYHQARRCMGTGVSLPLSSQQQVDDDDTNNNTIPQHFLINLATTSLSHCLHILAPPPTPQGKEAKTPKGHVVDLEAGTAASGVGCSCCYKDDEVVGSFLAQAGEAKLLLLNDDEERFLLVCCLGSIAMCMGESLKEAQQLEAHIIDLSTR
jgi:hypothetical protein